MSTHHNRVPVPTGEAAPDFSLPEIHRDGMVSLRDHMGRSALLLVIFRGLYCPFCRRAIAQFSAMNDKLRQAGVEPLAVVATDGDNARLYFQYSSPGIAPPMQPTQPDSNRSRDSARIGSINMASQIAGQSLLHAA